MGVSSLLPREAAVNARRLICVVAAHRYRKIHHPDSDAPGEYFLLCDRCGHRRGMPEQDPHRPGYYSWDIGG